MNWERKEANELIHGPLTRARAKKIKAYDGSLAKGMVAFFEEAMKNNNEGFEDQGEPSKLLTIYTIRKPTADGRPYTYPPRAPDQQLIPKGQSSKLVSLQALATQSFQIAPTCEQRKILVGKSFNK
ncbi:hypothetical protein M9H77_17321 [Catharanthus roseus]|uniref:Uncharacterized protein n=1 Tax=Catharanthus roseus TaxID=4058 RepID=A0ACC0B4B5_CATRO|nr:hypothetical protein M9H77_17321 [Catharanthus roseus]